MTFRVEVTAQAEHDSDLILDWLLSHHAGNAGVRWIDALHDAIKSLGEFPKRCALAPESKIFPIRDTATSLWSQVACVSHPFHDCRRHSLHLAHPPRSS